MKSLTIAGWQLALKTKDHQLHITVKHEDGTPVADTDADIGGCRETGYRLTSEGIEAAYRAHGDPEPNVIEDKLTLNGWVVDIRHDEDNHLNLYVHHLRAETTEHLSVNNGTTSSPACDIVITDSTLLQHKDATMTQTRSRTLTPDDVKEINALSKVEAGVSVSEMKDLRDRTLMYGYDCDRNTFHVYLEDGVLHSVYYTHNNKLLNHTSGESLPISATTPNKRVYPETCDYEFCKLIQPRLKYTIPFTTYNDRRDTTGPFFGETVDALSS